MADETVTLVLDAEQYYREIAKVTSRTQGLSRAGERVGDGFVSGERVIRRATQNIAGSILMAGDATSTFLSAASQLERVFKIGIGPTIGVAAGIKVFEIFYEQIKKTKDAFDDLKKEIARPIRADPVTAEMDKRIEDLTEKIKSLDKEAKNAKTSIDGMFLALAGIAAKAFLPSIISRPIISSFAKAAPPGLGQLAELSKQGIDKLEALAAERGRQILAAADKLHQALEDAVQRFKTSTGNLFRDIGSGQFAKDQFQRNLENQQTRAGQDMVRQFEEDLANGVALGPLAQQMVAAARAAAAKGGVGIEEILNADFSNLDLLSKYDFSGLAPLSNLTIIIK